MKLKNNKYRKTKIITFVVLILLGSWLVFAFNKKPAKAPETNSTKTISSSQTTSNTTQTIETPIDSLVDLSKEEMPVLMYHHIRDYNVVSDKIGTNLSVSPQNFASQLDLIASKGFTTTTFAELSSVAKITKPIILTFDDGYKNFYDNAYPELKKRNMKAVAFIITNSIGGGIYMSADQIKEISQNGIEIGSHTKSHPDLSTMDATKAKIEIDESKSTLESLLGQPIISFCYPSGKYSAETLQLVETAGYKFATATKSGITKFATPFELTRDRVNADTHIDGYLK